VELRRLDNHHERDAVFVIFCVPMGVELRHQSDEYSSLVEPDFALKSFHIFTVDSIALDRANCSSRTLAKWPESSDSTTCDKLSVKPFA
jgi:hypothetical protein